MKAVWRFLNNYIEQILLFVMISILICSVTLQVFTRIIGSSFSWTEEVARYSFVWFVMIGMSYATKHHLHIRMEVILALLHGKKRSCFEILLQMFALCICGYLFYLCLDYVEFSYKKKAPAHNITMSVLNVSGIVGIGLNCVRIVQNIAMEVAKLYKASVVLGSATPSLEAYYRAGKGEYRLFHLTKRLTGGELPTVHTVDLRQELKEGNRSIFSRKLQELMTDRLSKGQQTILFLNRRGYAGFVSCRACGEVMKCPHCDVSLSEHKGGRLICHYCGYTQPLPKLCPKCGSKYILGFKAGTQQIEDKLKELYPGVRTLRMDADTTRTKDSYEKILSAFSNGEADVLIGTQMIVKGHDFPKVTLVGILAADLSLNASDYRAGERTFQLLTQAVGRAGRGVLPGEAVIQTYQPDHYAITCAAAQDYKSFYEEEILYRELSGYPPAAHMLAVQIYGKEEENVKQLARRLTDVVKSNMEFLQILGPTQANISKINDIYRYVFYAKHAEYDTLVAVKDCVEETLRQWQPRQLSIQFDFDPVNVL